MTSIRFVGDVPLWAGLLVAVAVGLGAWKYYRRESHDLPGRLRWLLPGLRATAFFLAVLTLTGPVLRHRRVIGQLGRVLVFLDGSASMGVTDEHMPVARQLVVAQQQNWLPQGQVDMGLWEMANLLAEARQDVAARLTDRPADSASLDECRESFAQNVSKISEQIDRYPWHELWTSSEDSAVFTWGEISDRFQNEVAEPAQQLLGESIDDVGSREEFAKRLLELCESALPFEQALRSAFDAYGSQLAASGSPTIASALALLDEMSRWRRAENSLLDSSSGLLAELTRTHDVELIGLSGSEAEGLWDRRASDELPPELAIEPLGLTTDLGSPIAGEMTRRLGSPNTSTRSAEIDQPTAVVMVTDGRHNSGESPLQTARVLGGQEIPVYTVGFGSRREPPDLALVEVEHPDTVFQKDRIRGTIVLKDRMPSGRPFVIQIGHGDEVLWQERLRTQDVPLRRIEFEFSIDDLVERLHTPLDGAVRHHAVPMSLEASIVPLDGEAETSNNESTMRLTAITQSYKLMLIDGRSRWETRYLRNVFQRDEQWHVDTILVGPATDQATLPRGDGPNMFPTDPARLFDYDLIVFGEVPPGILADYERGWIRDFVETRGGGIIFVDGQRGYLHLPDDEKLGQLVPVSPLPGGVVSLPTRLQLTDLGVNQIALMLESTSLANERFWRELPAPHRIVPVEALPGAEVFVEAVVDGRELPVMVTRSFGAGRALYLAFDETWRWRYKMADTCHQRFWNQVAKWTMPRPFAVSDDYVSLDSGPPSYARGDTAELRVRLRGADGRPVSDASVDALLWQDARIVSTVSLNAEDTGHGTYRGRTEPLSEGEYEVSVRAAGFSHEALKARTQFVVLAPESVERQQIACNDELLREMASASGGRFLPEERIGELPELLSPLSSGHVVESETLLWQSYWWFAAIVGLLAIEWALRKRAGLL
jgi:hypothetical protein